MTPDPAGSPTAVSAAPTARAQARQTRKRRRRRLGVSAAVVALVAFLAAIAAAGWLWHASGSSGSAAGQSASGQSPAYQAYLVCQGVSGQVTAASNDVRAFGQGLATQSVANTSLGDLDITLSLVSTSPTLAAATRDGYARERETLAAARAALASAGPPGVPAMITTLDSLLAADPGLCPVATT